MTDEADPMKYARELGISPFRCNLLESGGILSFTKLCDQFASDLMKLSISLESVQHIRQCLWKVGTDLKPDSQFYRRTPQAEAVVTRSGRINCLIEDLDFDDADSSLVRRILGLSRRGNLMDVDAVCARTERELLGTHGFGRRALNTLKEALVGIGRGIGDNLPIS
jgi:DNA-directed RNA polymerase alpha subunit